MTRAGDDSRRFAEVLGAELHQRRRQQGISLRGLADKAGVSASLLSDIERGRVNPSVANLFRLATALGVPPHRFFPPLPTAPAREDPPPAEAAPPVVRAGQRASIQLIDGVSWQRLTPQHEGGVEFIEMHYEPGASSGDLMHHHPGRELGLVLAGELTLELGFQRYTLTPGDSVAFDSTTPHRLSNRGRVTVRLAWVNINTPSPGSSPGPS